MYDNVCFGVSDLAQHVCVKRITTPSSLVRVLLPAGFNFAANSQQVSIATNETSIVRSIYSEWLFSYFIYVEFGVGLRLHYTKYLEYCENLKICFLINYFLYLLLSRQIYKYYMPFTIIIKQGFCMSLCSYNNTSLHLNSRRPPHTKLLNILSNILEYIKTST